MGRKRILTDEERELRKKEYYAKWYQENKEKKAEQNAKRYQKNRDKILEQNAKWRAENPDYYAKWREENPDYQKEYYKTPMGRAVHIAAAYDRDDEKYNRGKCTLTPVWIVYNIFPMPCHYCGAMGWEIMGCDRVDNSKPHTPDNVVPCCAKCNRKRHLKSYEEFKKEMEGV